LTLLLVFVFLLLHKFAYNLEKTKLLYSTSTSLNKVISKSTEEKNKKKDTKNENITPNNFIKNKLIPSIQKEVSNKQKNSASTIVIISDSTGETIYPTHFQTKEDKFKEESISASFFINNESFTCYYHINNIKIQILTQLKSAMLFTIILILFFILIFSFIISRWRNGSKESKLKDDFFQNVTHELKTPIATTAIATDLFKKFEYDLPVEKVKNYIEIMVEENRKMKQIVDRILSISIVENSNESKLSLTDIDIHKTLSNTLKNFQFVVSEREGQISSELNAKNATIYADESLISMIFSNLIDNAIKYSNGAPMIKILSESTQKGIIIRISDQGIGIPAEALSKIFIKTYRIKSNKNIKGFGLGLYFVKQLVELHHGKISVKSEVNIGTEFTIFLPFSRNS